MNTRGGVIWLPPVGDSAKVHLAASLHDAAADSFIRSAAGGCSLSPQYDSEAWLPIELDAAEAQTLSVHNKLKRLLCSPEEGQVYAQINKLLNYNKRGLLQDFQCPCL